MNPRRTDTLLTDRRAILGRMCSVSKLLILKIKHKSQRSYETSADLINRPVDSHRANVIRGQAR
jgi:hypothetical protein